MKVYIAGPYTKGDVAVNVRNAIEAGVQLIDAGHAPFIPHLSHFIHLQAPRPWQTWMAYDCLFLTACDALVRLPGESVGADIEVDVARRQGIPVYEGTAAFLEAAG